MSASAKTRAKVKMSPRLTDADKERKGQRKRVGNSTSSSMVSGGASGITRCAVLQVVSFRLI